MNEFSAATEEIAAFGATAGLIAARIEAAHAGTMSTGTVSDASLLGPVFGVIGGEFVAAFGTAQSAHAAAIGRLASAWSAISVAAHSVAVAYDTTDGSIAATLSGDAS